MNTQPNTFRRIVGITLATLALTTTVPAAHAGLMDRAKAKVHKVAPAAKARVTGVKAKANGAIEAVSAKVSEVRSDVRSLTGKVDLITQMSDIGRGVGDGAIGAIVDSVQPLVELVRERQQEFQAFDAEGFRYDLAAAVDNIAYLQSALIGRVGPGVSKLQAKIQTASPIVLFAMSESPLSTLLELTQGMGDELRTVVRLTSAATDYVHYNLPEDQARRAAGLGMAIAAPEFVSCDFVMDNVDPDDIGNLKLSRLRAKQISGVAGLALKVLPKSQTIGVNVVGGATLSIPNPIIAAPAAIQRVADKYYDVSKKWATKYDDCKVKRLNTRMAEFLAGEGYPLVD